MFRLALLGGAAVIVLASAPIGAQAQSTAQDQPPTSPAQPTPDQAAPTGQMAPQTAPSNPTPDQTSPSATAPAPTGAQNQQMASNAPAGQRDQSVVVIPRQNVTSEEFVREASANQAYQAMAGQIALQRSQSPDIKVLAQSQIDASYRAQGELAKGADQAGVKLPLARLTPAKMAMLQKLKKVPADQFDSLYTRQQITTSMDSAALQQGFAQSGSGPLQTAANNISPHAQDRASAIFASSSVATRMMAQRDTTTQLASAQTGGGQTYRGYTVVGPSASTATGRHHKGHRGHHKAAAGEATATAAHEPVTFNATTFRGMMTSYSEDTGTTGATSNPTPSTPPPSNPQMNNPGVNNPPVSEQPPNPSSTDVNNPPPRENPGPQGFNSAQLTPEQERAVLNNAVVTTQSSAVIAPPATDAVSPAREASSVANAAEGTTDAPYNNGIAGAMGGGYYSSFASTELQNPPYGRPPTSPAAPGSGNPTPYSPMGNPVLPPH